MAITLRPSRTIRAGLRGRRLLVVLGGAAAVLAACSGDETSGPDTAAGDLLVVTSIPDQSGVNGSSFVQTASLAQAEITNADAFEQTFFPYVSIRGNDVIVTQGLGGDQAVRYVRGADGRLSEAGRMSLPPGGFGANVVFASSTLAYVAVTYAGKIISFNPQTMTATGEIDLTALDISRNPSNPEDNNPEPAVMSLRDGKLFVGLQQLVTGFASADGADVAVIDAATAQLDTVVQDTRTASPGRYGYNQTMFLDEAGDLYVYCVASFGFVAGQKAGFLRIRAGESGFDPGYFVNLTEADVDVPGGKINLLNGIGYGGEGYVYAIAQVLALTSNPPQYATDRNFQAIRVHLPSGEIEALPLPLSNGIATGVTFKDGKVIFGLATATGVGLYTYDPVTGEGSQEPVVRTTGDPTLVLAFE
jgi:hypothetical protein